MATPAVLAASEVVAQPKRGLAGGSEAVKVPKVQAIIKEICPRPTHTEEPTADAFPTSPAAETAGLAKGGRTALALVSPLANARFAT